MELRPLSDSAKNQIYHYTLLQEENIFSEFPDGSHTLQTYVDSIDKKFFKNFEDTIFDQDHRENYYED